MTAIVYLPSIRTLRDLTDAALTADVSRSELASRIYGYPVSVHEVVCGFCDDGLMVERLADGTAVCGELDCADEATRPETEGAS